jgi:hypothetical protein
MKPNLSRVKEFDKSYLEKLEDDAEYKNKLEEIHVNLMRRPLMLEQPFPRSPKKLVEHPKVFKV